ncbi:hypothetical protein V8B55DRAFT_1446187 [Mucor lusitanicus]|uniref:Uncharacterized protein n=2 Tax=Mucor circinelloides f. lusitanicus TaxID=29924 RepID=A0A162RFD0_MUCCL|nr:hypothetical protein FB192DRAFT_1362293 [Mucor lusitanicus]OAD04779.1 hypothetical protein MUCCIDRAFT_155715 [Mucor lusitanicus CBS 277.49]
MNEKTQIIQQNQQELQGHQETIIDIDPIASTLPSPPCYEATTLDAPPPPSYLQSTTRLYYKNQPYISDSDQALYGLQEYQHCTESDDDSDSWSDIVRLPLRQRARYYFRSWMHTVYDGRLIFFAFFVLAAIIVLGLVASVVAIPSLFRHY